MTVPAAKPPQNENLLIRLVAPAEPSRRRLVIILLLLLLWIIILAILYTRTDKPIRQDQSLVRGPVNSVCKC